MNKEILFKNRNEWRLWLRKNHNKEMIVWLIYYKKHVNKKSVVQPEAVEEALCYGWIDSIVKRIDEERYIQKFTPRNEKSIWSDVNKKRVEKLINKGKMTEPGMEKIRIAKKNGSWNKIQNFTNIEKIPNELKIVLSKNKIALSNFDQLASSHKKQYIYWIGTAKKEETRKRRSEKAVQLLVKNKKLGMV
jgi:uncharacterized protein YdeI (YjbR/CyaY-like superfamily)